MKVPEDEDDDPIWGLLSKAKKVVVNPFFSRNVLRTLRMNHEAEQARWGFLQHLWGSGGRWALGGVSAIMAAAWIGSLMPWNQEAPYTPAGTQLAKANPLPNVPSPVAATVATSSPLSELPVNPIFEEDILDRIDAEMNWLGEAATILSTPEKQQLKDEQVSEVIF